MLKLAGKLITGKLIGEKSTSDLPLVGAGVDKPEFPHALEMKHVWYAGLYCTSRQRYWKVYR